MPAKKKVANNKRGRKNPVNAKRLRFCHEYVIDHNGAGAARRAGYSEKTAASIADELLKTPELKLVIASLEENVLEKAEVDAVYVLKGAKEMFERCMQREQVMERVDGCMVPTGEWKFDSSGAGKALKILGDHVSVNAFKATDDAGVPIDQNWKVTIVDGREKPADP